MPYSTDEIIGFLHDGSFDALIGEFESDCLECKGQPYSLSRDRDKLELAKDVAGLANANGGLLLIGLSTKKSVTHGKDQIDRVRPFPVDMFNQTSYDQVLADWLWPPIAGLRVNLFYVSTDPTKAVAAIIVPAVSGPDRPVLVAKTLLDTPRKVAILFGYCERKQEQVTHHDIKRLQTLIRDGQRLDSEIRESFQSMLAMLEELRSQREPVLPATAVENFENRISGAQREPAPSVTTNENIESRISGALRAVGLYNAPAFVLAAVPLRKLSLHSLFESRQAPIVQLLEKPPELRSGGFDIDAGLNSRIHEGRLRRVLTDNFKLLEIHRDGLVVFATRGDSDGQLCWGRQERQRQSKAFLINQIALIEMTYLFARFVDMVFDGYLDPGSEVRIYLKMLHLALNGNNCYLEPGPIGRFSVFNPRKAPKESFSAFETYRYKQDLPERVAEQLVAYVYTWFGFDEDGIPYTKISTEGRVIDRDALASVG